MFGLFAGDRRGLNSRYVSRPAQRCGDESPVSAGQTILRLRLARSSMGGRNTVFWSISRLVGVKGGCWWTARRKDLDIPVGPVVIADIEPAHRLAQEEIFGPIPGRDARPFDQALEYANGTAYALTGGLYSRSPRNIARVREAFDVGNVLHQPPHYRRFGRLPTIRRAPVIWRRREGRGEEYLKQFLVARVVSEQTLRRGFIADPVTLVPTSR